ncbi:hypothetical protein HHK36_030377 [Tetracentron sinense]|uniref:mitogen-activated protein kinase kinase kinase n=1 Tax=Tetracentron sinense TaxID=13715 RepID=A0A835CYN4_TETSI|nr:hypothetical protein HHK36_030377 [Tetracentron sinense]
MHNLPRFFRHSSKGESMDPKLKRQKPKLDRRNALRNIDYDASTSSSSFSEDPSDPRFRSLDFSHNSDRTSFRVEGNDGDFDRICRSLGLSGPEDFAIPVAAWEARKALSSSDPLPLSRFRQPDTPKREEPPEKEDGNLVARFTERVRFTDESKLATGSARNSVIAGSTAGGGGGIKGVRPPVLAPPPAMLLPISDNVGSTWDILRSFAPEDDKEIDVGFSSDDEEEGGFEEDARVEGGIIGREKVNESCSFTTSMDVLLSESCSFTTSIDDDSSSTASEPMCSISPHGRFKRNIKYWEKGELLGSGSFGTVFEGISDDGFFFAVKEVSLLDQGSQGKQSIYQLEQEIALLSQFEHENIVQYLGTDKDEAKLYIFLELVTKGSLLKLYQRYHLVDSQVSAYTRQILHGLKYLHERNVVHSEMMFHQIDSDRNVLHDIFDLVMLSTGISSRSMDIKCANILVDANGSVKLADFGLAKATKLNDVKSCKGTAFWMAPEVVNRKTHGYGLAADIWSLGCTVLEMLTHQLPYSDLECMQALFRIGKGIPPPIPNSLSRDAQNFIHQCLQVNPENRPTAAQLLDHPFVKRPLPTFSGTSSPHSNGRRSRS